jgi:DNA-binding NarL/FixJ family response regulator
MVHKVLIVENEPEYYFNFKDILVNNGFDVADFCPTYEDAMELLESFQPDIAVLDIDLDSEKNGIDLGNYLYKQGEIPFVFMTALNDRAIFNKALHTHHQSFLVKTDLATDKEKVVRTILTVLNNYQQQKSTPKNKILGATGLKGYFQDLKNSMGRENFEFKRFIDFDNIAYFSTDRLPNEKFEQLIGYEKGDELKKNYIWFQTDIDGEIFIMQTQLNQILDLLPDYFVRINQQTVANISTKFLKKARTDNHLYIYDQEFKVARKYRKEIDDKLNARYL